MNEITIDELKDLLRKDKVSFEFTKKDGTLRQAVGTLKEELISEEKKPKSETKKESKNLRFYDLDKKAWRSIYSETDKITLI